MRKRTRKRRKRKLRKRRWWMETRPMHEVEKRRNRKSLLKSEAETFCKFLCKNLNFQNAVKKTAVQSKLVQSHPDVESSAPRNFKISRFQFFDQKLSASHT